MKKERQLIIRGDSESMKPIADLFKQLDQKTLMLWATDCAEHALHFFEEIYPNDSRPRQAIETGRAWERGEIRVGAARAAALVAHGAARDAKPGAARAAARAAGHAAATAHVATHAIGASIYAISAANFAADPADADAAADSEREWDYRRLLEITAGLSRHPK